MTITKLGLNAGNRTRRTNIMRKECGSYSTRREAPQARGCNVDAIRASSSRRAFLKAGAGLVAGGAVAPGSAIAQGVGVMDADPELRRLQTTC
jgi:hypothetical protein